MVTAALLAALTCAATMSVRIPTLGTGGYIHPGDALVILCGIILGPSWGFFGWRHRLLAWLTFLAVYLFMCYHSGN